MLTLDLNIPPGLQVHDKGEGSNGRRQGRLGVGHAGCGRGQAVVRHIGSSSGAERHLRFGWRHSRGFAEHEDSGAYSAHDDGAFVSHDGGAYSAHDDDALGAHDGGAFVSRDGGAYNAHDGGAYGAHDDDAFGAHDGGAFVSHDGGTYGAHDGGAYGAHSDDAFGAHDEGAFVSHDGDAYGAHDDDGHDTDQQDEEDGHGTDHNAEDHENNNIIDLNVMANRRRRTFHTDDDKRLLYTAILEINGRGPLKRGVTKKISAKHKVPVRVLRRIWDNGRRGGGVNAVINKRAGRVGRKCVTLDSDALAAVPPNDRTTIRDVAGALNMAKTTVHRLLKEHELCKHTNELKPMLTEENKKARVTYCISNLEPASMPENPVFKDSFNVVHIDEKWFYRTRKTQGVYLGINEPNPVRHTKNKGHIEKIMFLAAVARPRYDMQGNCTFDGKIGIWPYVEWKPAQRRSPNRPRGTLELKPCDRVGMEKSREYLITKVLPAIKEKWPQEDRCKPIFIQQDNAKTHVRPDDPVVCAAATQDGWDIRVVMQPLNSPDTNALDLGVFNSLQSAFEKKMPKNLQEILQKVDETWNEHDADKSNRVFLSNQAVMREIIKHKGSIDYDLPHLKKKSFGRGKLPRRLPCEPEFVVAALEYVA
ncbi:uncharacterized protein LOC123409314 [Hordeum vulgare subsp. vulgare]|uniref:uncharacterized protein LOC123409314 n=1 Tax=Hordeum vulgare subsp. vulgare TaxID=112509 RepID=UPI001D1A5844|nr:uncharacterized protein LOC123409314 [Hordeum vulgare subsp. vulgare]